MRNGFRPVAGLVLSAAFVCTNFLGLPAIADSTGKASSTASSVDSKSDSTATSAAPEPILHPQIQ